MLISIRLTDVLKFGAIGLSMLDSGFSTHFFKLQVFFRQCQFELVRFSHSYSFLIMLSSGQII